MRVRVHRVYTALPGIQVLGYMFAISTDVVISLIHFTRNAIAAVLLKRTGEVSAK